MSKAQRGPACSRCIQPAGVCGRPYQACLHASGVHVAAVLFCHPSAPRLEFRTSSEHLRSNLVLTHFGGLRPHATHFRLWLGMDSVDDSGNSWGLMKLNFPIGASTAVLTWMPVCLHVAWRRTLHLMGSMPWWNPDSFCMIKRVGIFCFGCVGQKIVQLNEDLCTSACSTRRTDLMNLMPAQTIDMAVAKWQCWG